MKYRIGGSYCSLSVRYVTVLVKSMNTCLRFSVCLKFKFADLFHGAGTLRS